jgi:hypothetical protein
MGNGKARLLARARWRSRADLPRDRADRGMLGPGCGEATHRADAHRLYLRERMSIGAFHFITQLL